MNPMRQRILSLCLAVAALAALTTHAARVAFDEDEFQHVHMAWLIHHGQVPYVDFFEHHSPLYHLLLSPLFLLGDGPFQISLFRGISVLSTIGVLLGVFRMARRESGSSGAAGFGVCLLAASPMFIGKMVEARPDSPALLCWVLAMGLLFDRKTTRLARFRLPAIGFLGTLVVLLSTKHLFAAAGLFGAVLVLHGWKSIGPLAGGALAAALPLGAWLAVHQALGACVDLVLLLNLGWKYRFSPAGYLVQLFSTCGVLVVTGLLGLAGQPSPGSAGRRLGALGLLLGGGLLGVAIIPVPYRQVFLPLFPVLAIGSALFLAGVLRQAPQSATRPNAWAAALAILTVASILPGLRALADDAAVTNAPDLQTMRQVESMDPTGPVFDGRGLMFHRPHVGRYAWMHEELLQMLDLEAYSREVVEALEHSRFPTVIVDFRVRQMPPAILDFIQHHYRPINGGPIWVPGLSTDRGLLLKGASLNIVVPGTYQVSWIGGEVLKDGVPLEKGRPLVLSAGPHTFKANGFADSFELILVKRL
jgi:hypothetical protein